MASQGNIDELRINIESDAGAARSNIAALADEIGKLKSAVSGVSAPLNELAGSLKTLAGVNATNLQSTFSALSQLNGIKITKTNAQNMSNLVSSLSSADTINGAGLSEAIKSIGKLNGLSLSKGIANALSGVVGAISSIPTDAQTRAAGLQSVAKSAQALSGIKISSSIGNQLTKIGTAIQTIKSESIPTQKFRELAQAMQVFASVPNNALSSTVNAIVKLPKAAKALHELNFAQFAQDCQKLNNALGPLPQKMGNIESGLKAIAKRHKEAKDATEQHVSALDRLKSALNIAITISHFVGTAKMAYGAFTSLIGKTNQYVEDLNLFTVAMGDGSEAALEFANSVSKIMGINVQEWFRDQGTFATMAKGMGVASDTANTLSQQLTQLGYDLASYYNLDTATAMEKLQAGLAGQLRPLRELGYDLSNARLKQDALRWGISESINDMTQAEKAMLRYRSIMEQVSWAHGDMARTLASPANMLRILSASFVEAATAIGKVFLPIMQAIGPVAIAVMKVVTRLANMLAAFTGGKQLAEVDYSDGVSASFLGDEDADTMQDVADATNDIADAADDANDAYKELKRTILGFDELNVLKATDTNSKSKTPKSKKSGADDGIGSDWLKTFEVPTYDFLKGAENIFDDIVNDMMKFIDRLGKLMKPFAEVFAGFVSAAQKQMKGLDIAGAIQAAIAAATALVSTFARNFVDIFGRIWLAFNVPATVTTFLLTISQLFLTLSSVVEAVGGAFREFSNEAIVPFVAWIGEKLRDALYFCMEILESWGQWFMDHTQAIWDFGRAAGEGADFVLSLARAIADEAFSVAAGLFAGINEKLQALLGILIESGVAREAARLLGAALTAWALGNLLATGLSTIGTVFASMAEKIAVKSKLATEKAQGFGDTLSGRLKRGMSDAQGGWQLLKEAMKRGHSTFGTLKDSVVKIIRPLKDNEDATKRLKDSIIKNKAAMEDARSKAQSYRDEVGKGHGAMGKLRDVISKANAKLQDQKAKLAESKVKLAEYVTSEKMANDSLKTRIITMGKSVASMASAKLGVEGLTIAETIMTGVTGAATLAFGALKIALAGLGLYVVLAALEGILRVIQPILDGITDFVAGLFGWKEAEDEATVSTSEFTQEQEEARAALEEEQRKLDELKQSVWDYCQSHDDVKEALEMSGMSLDDFAQKLSDAGMSMDDFASEVDNNVSETLNSFEKLETGESMSLDTLVQNLENNKQVQAQWSDDMTKLMEQTGLDANSAVIKGLMDAGPEKVGNAVHEAVTNPGSEESQHFVELMKQILEDGTAQAVKDTTDAANKELQKGLKPLESSAAQASRFLDDEARTSRRNVVSQAQSATKEVTDEMKEREKEAEQSGKDTMRAYKNGIASASNEAQRAAADAAKRVTEALSVDVDTTKAGEKIMRGYEGGINNAVRSAQDVARNARDSILDVLGDKYGYDSAKTSGYNVAIGFNNGIAEGSSTVYATAQTIANNVATIMRSALEIHSPSRVMQDIGKNISLGMAQGMDAYAKAPLASARGLISDLNTELALASASVNKGLSGGIGASLRVSSNSNVGLDMDWGAMEAAVEAGVASAMLAVGQNTQAQNNSGDLIIRVGQDELGRAALTSIRDMAARGLAPDLVVM